MNELILLFLTVPMVTAFVGWVTNWAAVKMIFEPEEYAGFGPFGWQGILPRQAHKFATGAADMATENLVTVEELTQRIDPDELESVFAEVFDEQISSIVEDAAETVRSGSWAILPPPVQKMVIDQVKTQSRPMIRELFAKLQGVSQELVDLHRLIYSQLSGANVRRLTRFTREIGAKELKFIEYYGGVFGFVIGLAQVGVWSVMQTWWLMPIVGAAVGLVTNWLAIQMIFRPHERTVYLGLFPYQGLFPKRQAEIAADYARLTADEIINARNLIRLIAEGEGGERIARLVTDTISNRIDAEWQKVEKMVLVEVTPAHLATVKGMIVTRTMQRVPELRSKLEAYLEGKLAIGKSMEEKLATLPKPDFERILRSIFEEDEVTLILVGGFLGATVGILQGALVLSLNL